MDESEDTISSDDSKNVNNSSAVKKPKKRSLVERELETNLTARVTSPVTNGDASSTSRYGRSRRLKTDADFCDPDKAITKALKSPSFDKTPIKVQSPVYRMHASNSPSRTETPKIVSLDSKIEIQIENIYNANISLSRFSTEEKNQSPSPVKKFPKVYIRKDLIQSKEKEETVTLIKNMFSPVKSCKPANSHLSNILERSSEKYTLNGNVKQNGYLDTSSVVKTLDFDGKKKRKEMKDGKTLSKSELFDIEAKCTYQVGDLAWARMGTYPFWPCIVTREPGSELFVKKKLFGRIERDIIHVTFFGDNGRRSWVVDTMLRKFLGLPEFEATRDQFTPEDKKKDPRLYAAFFISEKKIALWKASVEEADTLLREPKRLRIDLLIELLEKSRGAKVAPKQQKQQKVRSDNDVPLSESLYDTLFSEDDAKPDDSERSRNKTRNKSLDVSEVVTACLDNMAAKTGMIKIQKQSHMDRWLQKAKSKTPEKLKVLTTLDTLENDTKHKDKAKVKEKESKTVDSKKKKITKETPTQKPYHFRRSVNESQHLRSHHNEHDYSIKSYEDMEKCFVKIDKTDIAREKLKMQKNVASKNSEELCVVVKVETLSDKSEEEENNDNKVISCRKGSDESSDTAPDKVIAQKSNDAIERKTEILSTEMEVDPPTQVDEDLQESTKAIEVNDQIDNLNEIEMIEDNIIEITEVNDTINLEPTIEIIEESDITLPTRDLQDSFIQNVEESILPAGINVQPDESIESGLHQYTSIQDVNDKSNKLTVKNIDCVVTSNINEDTDVEASDGSSKAEVNDVNSEDKDGVTIDEGEEITKSNAGIDDTEDKIKISSIECVIEHITSDGEDSVSNSTSKESEKANDTMAIDEQIEIVKENLQSDSEKTENLLNNIDSKEMNTVSVLKNDEEVVKREDNIPELILDAEVPSAEPNEKTVVAGDKKPGSAADIEMEKSKEPMPVNEKDSFTNDSVNDIDSKENATQAKSFEMISKPNELTTVAGGKEPENAEDIETENSEEPMPVDEKVSLTNDNVNDMDTEENDIQAKSFEMIAKPNEKTVAAGGKEPENLEDIEMENSEGPMPVNKKVSLTNDNVNDIDSEENDTRAKLFKIVSTSVQPLKDVLVTAQREISPEIVHTTIEANQNNVPELMLTSHEKSTDDATVSSKKDLDNDNVIDISIISPVQSVEDILVPPKQDIGDETLPEIAPVSSMDSTENDTVSVEEDTNHDNLCKITSDSTTQSSKDDVSTKENKKEIDTTMLDIAKTNEILENGFYDDELPNLKFDNLESETESINSEFDDISLSELKLRSKKINCNTENVEMGTKDPQKEIPIIVLDSQIDTVETNLPKIVKVKTENTEVSILDTNSENNTPRRSRFSLRKSELQKDKGNDKHVKEDSPPRKNEEECDPDTISIKSEDSTASTKRKRKEKAEKVDNLKDPEFLRYLELRQDVLIEEHPELTIDEIIAYLYKTWLYENSMKSDQKKSDDIEQSNLVKGQGPSKPIKQRKTKAININKVLSQELKKSVLSKESKDKPKRKTSQPYYNEEFSDIEDEIQMFEIFNSKSKDHVPKVESTLQATEIKIEPKDEPKTDTQLLKKETSEPETIDLDEYDEVEAYFEELTKPKPNIFKGLVREKVCEICERTNNLLKCKGCHGMFHADCVRKQKEIVEVPLPTKGRKKKKKPRGRKPKVSTDSNGVDSESQSDEKSQDLSEDFSISLEDIESERIVTDADLFEAQFSTKMKEILERAEKIDYEAYSTDEELDWKGIKAGKCKIVDIKLKPRSKPIELDFKCHNCLKHNQPICFVCKSIVSPKTQNLQKQKCQIAHCYKYYHLECLEQWPQTQFNSGEPSRNNKKISEFFEAMSCPRHVCHTCVSDDPRGCKTRFSGDKLARCVKCPATYHSFTKCLPAGSQILTASQIICPRHYEHRPGKVPCHVNTGWCFICALGGSLICCEYCPTSFHAECLNIKPPEGGYMCEDCETGRLPLYGEIVWVKLGHYRWWPGIILHPFEIPENIMAVKHSFGEFVVRFFGQYDHYWVNRGRVFPFQEGDSGKVSGQKSKIDEAFTVAMEHAQRAFSLMKSVPPNEEESLDIASSLLPPHYVKLKVNKPCGSLCGRRIDVEESSLTQCECNPDEEEPCGLYSHCLNRMLLTECGPTCRAGDRCNNRAFEKRQYPKLVPYRTPHRGWGLKTLEDIKAGQFVIEYVGELIDEEEFQRRMRRKHEIRDENFYFLTLDKERMIDAGPKGNSARFMNHCCEPNCETQKWTVLGDVRVGLFAINDIPANSEVTFNYNLECAGIEKKQCLCGATRCSGYIGAKPKQDEPQSKKNKIALKRTYKKRKNLEESPSTSKMKPKRPVGRPAKPRELTEIEKDLLIIKNATNGISSDSECSRLSSLEGEGKGLKRKRVSLSEDRSSSPSVKRLKIEEGRSEVGD